MSEFDALFNHNILFDGCELVSYGAGRVSVCTKVNSTDLNPYGTAHGGYLYTLCDTLAGVCAYSSGNYCVTMQADIHYMKGVKEDDVLLFSAETVHNGRKTKVVNVSVTHEEELICQASFSMYAVADTDHKN